jgi:hypothetical protein
MEQQAKKGMSKGCLVGLIVAGALIVLGIIAVVIIYMYKDDIVKFGVRTVAVSVKSEVAAAPPEGVDTVQFNALVDQFVLKLDSEDRAAEEYASFATLGGEIMQDKKIDAEEVAEIEQAMVTMYPELVDLLAPISAPPDSLREYPDSASME